MMNSVADFCCIFPSYRYVVVCEKSLLFGLDVNAGRKYHSQLTTLQRDVKKSTLMVEQLNKNGKIREMGENYSYYYIDLKKRYVRHLLIDNIGKTCQL